MWNPLNILYYQFYRFSELFNNIPGSVFQYPKQGGIMILSTFEMINLITLWIYLRIEPILNEALGDILIGFLILSGLNYLIFFKLQNIDWIIEKQEQLNRKTWTPSIIITFGYMITSIGLLIEVMN